MANDPIKHANCQYRARTVSMSVVNEWNMEKIYFRKYYEEEYERNAEVAHAKKIALAKTALKSLNQKQYDAVKLCILRGMTQIEAAKILHCSQQAVSNRLERAVRNMRKIADP